MNMTFFLYIIKDIMDFNGFYKENNAAREIKNALYKFELLTQKTEYLSKALANLEWKKILTYRDQLITYMVVHTLI